MIQKYMMPAIERASIAGKTAVRLDKPVLHENPIMIDMIMDVLTDRGFHAMVRLKPMSQIFTHVCI